MTSRFQAAVNQDVYYSLNTFFDLELARGCILRRMHNESTQRGIDHAIEIAVGKARRIAVTRALLRRLTYGQNKNCYYLTVAASVLEEHDAKVAILSRSTISGLACEDYDWAVGEYLRKNGDPVGALRAILDPLLPEVFSRADVATNSTPMGPLPSSTPSINYVTLMNFNPLAHPDVSVNTIHLAGSINPDQTHTLHPGNIIPKRLQQRTDAIDHFDEMQLDLLDDLRQGLYQPLPPMEAQILSMERNQFELSAFEGDGDIKLATAVLLADRCKGNTSLQSFNRMLHLLNTNLSFGTGLDGKGFFGEQTEEQYSGRVFEAIYKQALETEDAEDFARWNRVYFGQQISFLLGKDDSYFPNGRRAIASSTILPTQVALSTKSQRRKRKQERKANNEGPDSKRAKLSLHDDDEAPGRKFFESCVIS